MRRTLMAFLLLGLHAQLWAVSDSTINEQTVREKILTDIQKNLERKNKVVDSTILKLDSRVGKLDSVLKMTGNPKERIDRLVERVQVLEEKQRTIEQNEINVYEANYQSAIINIVSMDREIKPLILFHSTKDFFNALTSISNPMNYEGFSIGFKKFKEFVDKVKEESATQKAIAEIIESTGSATAEIPLIGAYSQLLFSGMSDYINSIGHNKRDLKAEAEKMFAVTASLSQFTTDKNRIENEWDAITESLQDMQGYYDSAIVKNLRMMGVDRDGLTANFTKECDANKRYLYLTMLRQKASDYVLAQKTADPKEWKEKIYCQLMDVQSIKVKYGDITYKILKHINKYDGLLTKYRTNKEIGPNMVSLGEKLKQLKATFDDAFEPSQYIHSAFQMYKVL